jgi:DNA repair exonuclease SbcCD ATPase subunit
MSAKMSLADFFSFARDNRKRMDDVYREIEEIQGQFNELYARQSQDRQKVVASLIPLLIAGSADLPPEMAQPLESREQAERKALRDELAALRAEETDKRQKVDNLVLEAQRQVAHLRDENPILNQQEEELKARRAAVHQELQTLTAEIESMHMFPIGWLTNASKRKKLSVESQRLVENLNAMTDGIRAVRAKWQEEKKALEESQANLRKQWQAMSVETAQVQTKAEYLASNLDILGKRNAAQGWLNELRDAPVASGAWKDQLAPLVELNRNRADYEAGLKSVSEILGLLKGLGEGMDRFIRSLNTVYEEQRRYKLPMLSVELSDAVTSFHASWPDTQAKVKDEKFLGTHPLEFSKRVQGVVQERLSEAAIQSMFEDMGQALNTATKAWH